MKRFKKILVCVDGSPYDAPVVVYTGGRSRVAESEELHFLHVDEDQADAGAGQSHGPERTTPESLGTFVAEHFKGHGREAVYCDAVRGSRLLEVLRYAHEKDIDLLVLSRHYGRHSEHDDDMILPRRITRKATCSVLVLPEKFTQQADELIVPVRDSECSSQALEVATGIAEVTGARLTALNIFRVTSGYSRVGTSREEHTALLRASAQRECDCLLERSETHGVKVNCNCMPDLSDDPVTVILDVLGDGAGKAVVIGARGRTGAAGVLLGTVTEQLIRRSPSPVLAVKKKGEHVGIVRALLLIASHE